MTVLSDILLYPFMQRALIAGIVLALLLAALGVLATLRKMAFFSEGIAHASLAGIALAVIAGVSPLPVAIAWAAIIAVLIFWIERYTRLSSDTVIGILFTASMALGVILMSLTKGYQPELVSFLFGNILSVNWLDVIIISILSTIILLWYGLSLRELTLLSLSEETAKVYGVNTGVQTLLLYVSLAVATVLGVKVLGIILVSALIVLPPAIARVNAHSFRHYLILSILAAEVMVVFGLLLSFLSDLPSGAVIVLTGTGLFLLSISLHAIKKVGG